MREARVLLESKVNYELVHVGMASPAKLSSKKDNDIKGNLAIKCICILHLMSLKTERALVKRQSLY